MKKVAITDYTFDDLAIEKGILEPEGLEIEGIKVFESQDTMIDLVRDADYVITQFAPVNAEVIGAMQKARIIVRYGIGVDNVDLEAAAAKRIPVCNVPDYCIDEVADHALSMILALTRGVTANADKVRGGDWGLGVPLNAMHALAATTVGVVGFGRIGREVVDRLRAFKCKVLVSDPVVAPAEIEKAGASSTSVEGLLAGSELVTLHCPSTETTRQMINRDSLATMKDGAMLVNTSRGTLVHTEDLIAALQSSKLSAAALDVADPEPLPADSPLRTMPNVVVHSHIASASVASSTRLRESVAGLVKKAARGEALPNVVNCVPGAGSG